MNAAYLRETGDDIGSVSVVTVEQWSKLMREAERKGVQIEPQLFFCPECGERTRFQSASARGKHPSPARFRHEDREKCVILDCDARVDSDSYGFYMPKQRAPIFILPDSDGSFKLAVGFVTPEEEKKRLLSVKNISSGKIGIKVGSEIRAEVPLQAFLRGTSDIQFVQLKSPIQCGAKTSVVFSLSKTGEQPASSRSAIWPDTTDWFGTKDCYGAIFEYSVGNAGEKIRNGGKITAGRRYLMIRKQTGNMTVPANFFHDITELFTVYKEVGSMSLRIQNSVQYSVAQVEFPKSPKKGGKISASDYTRLVQHLQERFGVILCDDVPETIPLWPPVIKKSEAYDVISSYRDGASSEILSLHTAGVKNAAGREFPSYISVAANGLKTRQLPSVDNGPFHYALLTGLSKRRSYIAIEGQMLGSSMVNFRSTEVVQTPPVNISFQKSFGYSEDSGSYMDPGSYQLPEGAVCMKSSVGGMIYYDSGKQESFLANGMVVLQGGSEFVIRLQNGLTYHFYSDESVNNKIPVIHEEIEARTEEKEETTSPRCRCRRRHKYDKKARKEHQYA